LSFTASASSPAPTSGRDNASPA